MLPSYAAFTLDKKKQLTATNIWLVSSVGQGTISIHSKEFSLVNSNSLF